MLKSHSNGNLPVIGANMLYTGSPKLRKNRGNTRDYYLVQHLYVEGILRAGGLPLLTPCVEDSDTLARFAERADGFLFIGGPDYPPSWYNEEPHEKSAHHLRERVKCDLLLIRHVLKRNIPIFGICAGAQLLNIALGGKLIQHLSNAESHTGEHYHQTEICEETLLGDCLKTRFCELNSSHHQAVDPAHLGQGLRISAYADDGTVEAVEAVAPPFRLGLQFHLERHRDEELRRRVFEPFVEAARAHAKQAATQNTAALSDGFPVNRNL